MKTQHGKSTHQTLLDTWITNKQQTSKKTQQTQPVSHLPSRNAFVRPPASITFLAHTASFPHQQAQPHPCAKFPAELPLDHIFKFIQETRESPTDHSRLCNPENLHDLVLMVGGWKTLETSTHPNICKTLVPAGQQDRNFVFPWMMQVRAHISVSAMEEILFIVTGDKSEASFKTPPEVFNLSPHTHTCHSCTHSSSPSARTCSQEVASRSSATTQAPPTHCRQFQSQS